MFLNYLPLLLHCSSPPAFYFICYIYIYNKLSYIVYVIYLLHHCLFLSGNIYIIYTYIMSNSNSRVTVLSKLTTVSSRPVGPDHTHSFTALDHAMGLHSLHIIFYFKDNILNDFDLDHSRVSLSETLSLYPQVTGRLTRDENGNWAVKCNDAGVRVVKALVGTTLDEWLSSADMLEEKDLTVWDDMPDDPSTWSPFRVQVSEFEGGGLAIGLSCTHMHADPTSATILLNSWTQVHRRQPITHPPFYSPPKLHLRPVTNLQTQSATFYETKSKQPMQCTVQMASATFRFSHATIKQLLLEIHEKCPDATPFDVLAALFWSRVARLKAGKNNDQRRSLTVCVDFRKLLRPPLPVGYYGNALHFSQLSLGSEEMEGCGLGHVAERLHHHMSRIEEEEEILSAMEWLESRKDEETGKLAAPFRMYGPELTCVNMEHMIVKSGPTGNEYTAMFDEDAGPVHVSYNVGNVEGEGLIMVMPGPEEGLGRTVTVTLPSKQLGELCEDEAVLGLHPKLLLSGRH
ncbi:hydroxycinnamoyltransferase [Ziziphus jujuba]|uniref:Hydroxycinnamoyltransferase n=1 Tax=Ziziphus jujuba TaxID=326968 RepID=A0A6P3ZP69_ZIZJJ|nr:hydroxycinnamoyltransferase [Ziziphus jujuba]